MKPVLMSTTYEAPEAEAGENYVSTKSSPQTKLLKRVMNVIAAPMETP